jgi:hypothetical protein
MKKLFAVGIAGLAATATGCASIVSGHNQTLSIEAKSKGTQVAGANCKLSNDKGTWFVTTPGTTTVNRSFNELAIQCEKEGSEPGFLSVKSSTKAMAFGNILFGGVIGAGVDIATGAAYDYPALLTVEMGESAVVTPPAPDAPRADAAVAVPPGTNASSL